MAFLLQFDLSAGVKAQALMQARQQATQDAKSTAGLSASVRPTAQLLCYMCPANANMLCSAIGQATSGAKSWCTAVHIILWMFRYASPHFLRCAMLSVIAVTVCLVRIPCLSFLAQCCEPTELACRCMPICSILCLDTMSYKGCCSLPMHYRHIVLFCVTFVPWLQKSFCTVKQ